MKWDESVHEDILGAVKDVIQDWNALMSTLHGMGYTFTESALK